MIGQHFLLFNIELDKYILDFLISFSLTSTIYALSSFNFLKKLIKSLNTSICLYLSRNISLRTSLYI